LLLLVCQYILAAVFLMAAVTKITAPEDFRQRILDEAHLPLELARIVIWVLPWLELTCGACLVLGYAVREAALLASILLVLFTIHFFTNMSEVDCGCFLTPLTAASLSWLPPVRNILLLACGVRVMWK
jgi:uncharacterized membrane protein YphA (DoxX/SURF4 family)